MTAPPDQAPLDQATFSALASRFFEGDADLDALYPAYRAALAAPGGRAALEDLFRDNGPPTVRGAAWWEERRLGGRAPQPDAAGLGCMFLSTAPGAGMRPRPHRPPALFARWRNVEAGEIELAPSGGFEAQAPGLRARGHWYVEEGSLPTLWLAPPEGAPLPFGLEREGDEMLLRSPRGGGWSRWVRRPEGAPRSR